MQDLGTLPEFNKASFARAINNQGQIVGDSESDNQKRAFVYSNGVFINLTRAAINMRAAGFSALDVADGINNKGWIVGFGTTVDGRVGAFLAIPVGVTNDPPGGLNAPVADSGGVGGFVESAGPEVGLVGAGIVGGWFCPPTLWRFRWHYHFVWRTPSWREVWNREHWRDHDRDGDQHKDRDQDKDKHPDKDKDHDKDKDRGKDRDHDKDKGHDRGPKGHVNDDPPRLEPRGDEHGGKPGEHHEGGKAGEPHEGGEPPQHHEGNKPPQHHDGGKPAGRHEAGRPPEHHPAGKPAGHPKPTPKKK